MKVLVIGGTGTIGKAVVQKLEGRHEVLPASRHSTPLKVNIADRASIAELFRAVVQVNAIVCAAGEGVYRPLANLTDDDFALSVQSKLMGQVNVVRMGLVAVADGGSITLTSGILARHPSPGSSAFSMVNAGVEAFVRAAALEMPRGIRLNVVSPGWVTETLEALHMDPAQGTAAAVVARGYVQSVEGTSRGQVIEIAANHR